MTRIGVNLSKDIYDVSPLEYDEEAKTNRQHLRVPISARGIRFGTLNLPRPHNRLIQTHGYSTFTSKTLQYPSATSSQISPIFESQEPWTRPDGVQTACPRSGIVTRNYISFAPNTPNVPWRGSTLQGTYPNSYFFASPPDSYDQRQNASMEFDYAGGSQVFFVNQSEKINIPLIRDDFIGVTTLGQPYNDTFAFNTNKFWSPNVARDKSFSSLLHITAADLPPSQTPTSAVLRRTGRYWVHRVFDHYGSWVNETETRYYQFFFEHDAGVSYVFNRWAWVDSAGGVKEQRMMARRKPCQFSTFVVQTQRRQWIDNGAGAAMAISSGAFTVQHRASTTDSFGGDADTSLPYVPWVAGEYPGHPSVDLSAFEVAIDIGDTETVANITANWPGVWYTLPTQSQYKWHRFRWIPSSPNWGVSQKRLTGYSERNFAQAGSVFCPLGWNARNFTTDVADDHEIVYSHSTSVQLRERESTSASHFGDSARLNSTLTLAPTTISESQGFQVANYAIHPLADVPEINKTTVYNRLRKQVVTQTAYPGIVLSPIASSPQWPWIGYETRQGLSTQYATVQPRIRLSRVYGPYGQADGKFAEFPWGTVPARLATGLASHYVYWMMYNDGNRLPPVGQFPIAVEGYNPNTKSVVTPNPIVVTITSPSTSAFVPLTATHSSGRGWFVSQRVSASDGFYPANLQIRLTNAFGGTFGLYAEHPAVASPGSFHFSICVFDGFEYSDPVAVTVNVLPPPPP